MNLEFTKNPIIQQAQLVIHHPQGDRASVTFLMHINCLHSFFLRSTAVQVEKRRRDWGNSGAWSLQGMNKGRANFSTGHFHDGPFHRDVILRVHRNIQCAAWGFDSNRTFDQA